MLVQQSYRYELKPNNKQKTLLAKHAGCARFAYNWGLARRIEEHKETQKSSNSIEQHRQLNALKKTEFPWMYEVSKCAPQEALRDLDKAYKNFFRSLKRGKKIGFPKFKKKGVHGSFRLTGSMRSLKQSVVLPRLGEIRTKERTNVKGRILSTTVSREADRWFVAFTVKCKREEYIRTLQETAVGVDVGINSFCILSDGTKIESPKPLEHSLRLLKRRSKQHSRKKIGSANRKKLALRLARLHRKIRNRRSDFLHKVSTQLTKTKSVIGVEDLNVKGMVKNRHLSLRISDAGWSEFVRQLDYKTKWYGSSLVKAPKFYPSSKMCSSCKTIKENFKLLDRIFRCEKCGLVIDRDVNAAINLKYLATGSSPGSYACRDTSGGGIPIKRESMNHVSLKQEADAEFSSGIFG